MTTRTGDVFIRGCWSHSPRTSRANLTSYSFVEWQKVTEYVVSRSSPYHTPSNLFHHFQNEGLRIGLKFGSEVDAEKFNMAVQAVKGGKRARPEGRPKPPSVPPPPRPPLSPSGVSSPKEEGEQLAKKEGRKQEGKADGDRVKGGPTFILPSVGDKTSSAKKRPVSKRISKEMIGKPTNFQHVCHVGFNPEAGFVAEQADHSDLQAHFASKGDTPIRPAPLPPPPLPQRLPPSTRKPKLPNLLLDASPSSGLDDSGNADNDDLNRNASLNSFSSQDALDVSVDSVEAPSAMLDPASDSSFSNATLDDPAPASAEMNLLEVDLIALESPPFLESVISEAFDFLDADDLSRGEAPAPLETELIFDPLADMPQTPTRPSKLEQELIDVSLLDTSKSCQADESKSPQDDLDEPDCKTDDDEIIDILTPPTPPPPRRRTNRFQDTIRPPEYPPPPPPPHPPPPPPPPLQ
ncbi:actin cytoskeleton-regulatory complex protein pan1-like isoform X2 [Penaeus japonicus]|uniref:actin cytoskeleton-regulatory complex protein pan1-like isoform X2 n=1 Tax=Penaeus japonicus TaxID=27405 RepID=UPI001C717716|nr:actin cytoskeleton-regulatory complex protein pan1-like isoform X2 [Penaeus japonicus]